MTTTTKDRAVLQLARVKQKGQVTIPASIRAEVGLDEGDYVEITRESKRIVLTPKTVSDRHPDIDAAIEEGLADIKAGRVSPAFKNMKEFKAWHKSPEGKKFRNA